MRKNISFFNINTDVFYKSDIAFTRSGEISDGVICSNKQRQDLYVLTYKNNDSQMQQDDSKSDGKAFEDYSVRVWY